MNINSNKKTQLQDYQDSPYDWNTLKNILQSVTDLTSEKSKRFSRDWFDDYDVQIHNLLKNNDSNRNELQKR